MKSLSKLKMMKSYLTVGVDANASSDDGNTALMEAAGAGHLGRGQASRTQGLAEGPQAGELGCRGRDLGDGSHRRRGCRVGEGGGAPPLPAERGLNPGRPTLAVRARG